MFRVEDALALVAGDVGGEDDLVLDLAEDGGEFGADVRVENDVRIWRAIVSQELGKGIRFDWW